MSSSYKYVIANYGLRLQEQLVHLTCRSYCITYICFIHLYNLYLNDKTKAQGKNIIQYLSNDFIVKFLIKKYLANIIKKIRNTVLVN